MYGSIGLRSVKEMCGGIRPDMLDLLERPSGRIVNGCLRNHWYRLGGVGDAVLRGNGNAMGRNVRNRS